MRHVVRLCCASLVVVSALAAPAPAPRPQNIVFILADDIGYGDLGCYGATKVQTPQCDRLAREGLRFTDAHAPSAVCTPTRYALMTGEYAWRKPGTGILPGNAGLIIAPGRLTVPALLKQAGYRTGVVGKWHLGLGATPTDYNVEIRPGPLDIGFDYAWLLPATGDRVPCVWVENRRVVNLDPADPIALDYSVKRGEPRSFVSGIPRIGGQTGGKAALWKDDEIADVLSAKAVSFIEDNRDHPFFLYFATHDIHVPRVPNARFRGTSQAGVRGDAIHSFDWSVGQVVAALERLHLDTNTLVVVTSDNGGVLDTNGPDEVNSGTEASNNGHRHNGALRGGKGTSFEGGTRVPFIVRWPGRVQPGTSDALVCHVDMLASLAALTRLSLPAEAGPDSFNVLPALLDGQPGRAELVENGQGLRQGNWKFVAGPRGGQLFDLAADIGESDNLATRQPARATAMQKRLQELHAAGRSRPEGP